MNIIDQAKEIASLVKKYNDQDLYQRIVDLRDEIFALKEENFNLKTSLAEIKKRDDIGSELVRDGNCYYKKSDVDRKQPFCMACYDYDGKLVNLILKSPDGYRTTIQCNICDKRKNNNG
jgi:hypothetical protein